MLITETVITAEEEKHIAAVQKAMEERGMLDHTIVHGVFVGPARSGKDSLMERLLGQMLPSVSPSTGVAENIVQVKVIQKSATFAANAEESIWSEMDDLRRKRAVSLSLSISISTLPPPPSSPLIHSTLFCRCSPATVFLRTSKRKK